ncbi:hypothetical protein A2Y83_04865, partial [Candidatus Falkowbacteria bacterium RBG_13_39_14]
ISEIIHCGDVCAPGALREIAGNFKGKIHLVYGNVDGDHEGMEKIAGESGDVIIYGDAGELEIEEFPPKADPPACAGRSLAEEIGNLKLEISKPPHLDHRTLNSVARENPAAETAGHSRCGGKPKKKKDKIKIAFTHFPWTAKELAETGKYKYVFYGHTHKPWEEHIGDCKLINPGTLAGMFYKASFAVWDVNTDNIELILLERI